MKNILKITIALAFIMTLSSCWTDKSKPNYQYMPDMYHSVGYETYSENPNYANGMTTQLPVEGTVARGQVPYDYPNTNEGYEAAKLDSKNPLEVNDANLEKGKKRVKLKDYLSKKRLRKMRTHPDMILQFAHFLRDKYEEEGVANVEIYADIKAKLNGRVYQDFIDKEANLAEIEWSFFEHSD